MVTNASTTTYILAKSRLKPHYEHYQATPKLSAPASSPSIRRSQTLSKLGIRATVKSRTTQSPPQKAMYDAVA